MRAPGRLSTRRSRGLAAPRQRTIGLGLDTKERTLPTRFVAHLVHGERTDWIPQNSWLQIRWDTPGRYVRNLRINVNQWAGWSFGRERTGERPASGTHIGPCAVVPLDRAADLHEARVHARVVGPARDARGLPRCDDPVRSTAAG